MKNLRTVTRADLLNALRNYLKLPFFIFLAVYTHTALGSSLYQIELPGLNTNERIDIQNYEGQLLLLSFFEPDCRWCYRQMKVFNEIHNQCQAIKPVAVGIRGDSRALRKEVRRAQVEYPAAEATSSLLAIVGEIPATPWTLVVNQKGEIIASVRGYYRQEQWQAAFDNC